MSVRCNGRKISYRIFIEDENRNAEKISYRIFMKMGTRMHIAIYILSFYKTLKL
jgi:hypothetical protein